MPFIGKTPTAVPLTANDIADGKISTAKLADTSVTNAKLNADLISAETELATAPADTDELLISDAGVLKRLDASLIGGGDCEKLASYDVSSNVTDFYFDNVFTSSHKFYKVVFGGFRPNTQSSGTWIRVGFRTGGSSGANVSGTYYQKQKQVYGNESTATASNADIQSDTTGVQIQNTWNIQSSSGAADYYPYSASAELTFLDPNQDDYKPSFHYFSQYNDSGHIGWGHGIGYVNTKISTGGITGLRFNMEANSFASGHFYVYGFKV